jgi:hypothetical protein
LFNHPCNKSLGGLEPPLQDEEKVGKTFWGIGHAHWYVGGAARVDGIAIKEIIN